jgi:hypothetical protein
LDRLLAKLAAIRDTLRNRGIERTRQREKTETHLNVPAAHNKW